MKLLKGALPNLAIAFNLALLIVIYLDKRNPMMGFLIGTPYTVLLVCSCLVSIAASVTLYVSWRRDQKKKQS